MTANSTQEPLNLKMAQVFFRLGLATRRIYDDKPLAGLGFMTTFAGGAEWAATGKVTLPIPPEMAAGK